MLASCTRGTRMHARTRALKPPLQPLCTHMRLTLDGERLASVLKKMGKNLMVILRTQAIVVTEQSVRCVGAKERVAQQKDKHGRGKHGTAGGQARQGGTRHSRGGKHGREAHAPGCQAHAAVGEGQDVGDGSRPQASPCRRPRPFAVSLSWASRWKSSALILRELAGAASCEGAYPLVYCSRAHRACPVGGCARRAQGVWQGAYIAAGGWSWQSCACSSSLCKALGGPQDNVLCAAGEVLIIIISWSGVAYQRQLARSCSPAAAGRVLL